MERNYGDLCFVGNIDFVGFSNYYFYFYGAIFSGYSFFFFFFIIKQQNYDFDFFFLFLMHFQLVEENVVSFSLKVSKVK